MPQHSNFSVDVNFSKHEKRFSLFHLNASSLRNKADEIYLFLSDLNYSFEVLPYASVKSGLWATTTAFYFRVMIV